MELESEDGSRKFPIEKGSKTELGRGQLGFPADDRTVSRHHISLQLHDEPTQKPSKRNYPDGEIYASFHVIGKNPIWVFTRDGEEKRVFRNSEKGDLRAGDRFSISLKKPLVFTLKKRAFDAEEEEEEDDEKMVLKAVERRKKRTLERKEEEEQQRVLKYECSLGNGEDASGDLGLGSLDLLQIDPVKEFGFLVMGQEFNQFPEQKIRHFKDWNWFLEEPREDSEDDQADKREIRRSRKGRRKKKCEVDNDDDWTGESMDEEVVVTKLRNGKPPKYSTRSKDRQKPCKDTCEVDNDDDWTGESMDEVVVVTKLRNGKPPKYSTRSKDRQKPCKDTSCKKSVSQKTISADEDENYEDEDDDTLGGFIVNDDKLEEEEVGDDNDIDEREEEEEEDYDEDDDNRDDDNGEEDTEY